MTWLPPLRDWLIFAVGLILIALTWERVRHNRWERPATLARLVGFGTLGWLLSEFLSSKS